MKVCCNGDVTLNFQLDWLIEGPDIWLNIFLSVSLKVFPNDNNIWISRPSKTDCPTGCGWVSSNLLGPQIEQKSEKGQILSTCLIEMDIMFSCLHIGTCNLSSPGFSDLDYYTQALLGLQLAGQIIGLFSFYNRYVFKCNKPFRYNLY